MYDGKVTVEKAKLLEAVRRNREQHIAERREALIGWRSALIRRCEEMLVEARNGEDPGHHGLTQPPDYEREYARVISMLEFSTEDKITLNHRQFQNYVLDDWEWSDAFKVSTQSYMPSKPSKG